MKRLLLILVAACAGLVLTFGVVQAQTQTWCDEILNSVNFYKSLYPTSNWEPYKDKLLLVREALGKGDKQIVRTEMSKFFSMLRKRDHGIHDVGADELLNFAAMVMPIQEYGISVPPPPAVPRTGP
jgi:hypothetical protein